VIIFLIITSMKKNNSTEEGVLISYRVLHLLVEEGIILAGL